MPFDMVSADDSHLESFAGAAKIDNLMALADGADPARAASNTVFQRTTPLTDTDEAYDNFNFD